MIAPRCGDPERAMIYLSRAVETAPEGDSAPFVLRCQCHTKLGNYESADQASGLRMLLFK